MDYIVFIWVGLSVLAGLLWKRKQMPFAAGFLCALLLSPVLGVVVGFFLRPDRLVADVELAP